MKNEDKIIEILAESLKKQDQMAEILKGQAKTLSKQSEILNEQGGKLDTVVDVIKDLAFVKHNTNVVEKVVIKFDMLSDHERRITALERRKKN